MSTTTGFPDFQAYAQWRGLNLLPAYIQTLPVGHTLSGPQLVSSWRGVQLRIKPSAGNCVVVLHWYDDVAETEITGSDTWNVSTGVVLSVTSPIKGQYCDLDINVTSAGAMTADTQLFGVNSVTDRLAYVTGGSQITQTSLVIAAGATALFIVSPIVAGPATVNWSFADNSGMIGVTVNRFNADGTAGAILADLGSSTLLTPFTQQVTLIDNLCGLQLKNADAVNPHTCSVRLVPAGR